LCCRTGLHAPHHRFTVTDLRHHLSRAEIAFEATLCLDGKPVGRISNPRGIAVYRALPGTHTCTPADIATYATACRHPHRAPVTVPDLLTALITESETADTVTELLAQGLTPVRVVRPTGNQHHHETPFGIRAPSRPDSWRVLGPALHHQRPLHDGDVFEIWHEQQWHPLPYPDPSDT
jgi:hypothetical protein